MRELVTAVVTALITVPLTVWLSLRRFYAEKLWERKLDAYVAIIEALHHLRRPYDEAIEAFEGGRDEPAQEERWKKSAVAYGEILKHVDMGELLICDEALAVLRTLIRDVKKSRSVEMWMDHLMDNHAAVWKCLTHFKRLAIEDLRISRGSWLPGPFRTLRTVAVRRSLSRLSPPG